MTLDERVRVVKLTQLLFPNEVERYSTDDCGWDCPTCKEQIAEWDALLWRVYHAILETNLI